MPTRDQPSVHVESDEAIEQEDVADAPLAAEIRDANARYAGAIEIRRTQDSRGWGLYALRTFRGGELVASSRATADLPRQGPHSVQVGWGRHVRMDLPARFVNHSCGAANVGIRPGQPGGEQQPATTTTTAAAIPSYDFYALRDIRVDEELLWDYECSEYEISGFECHCGSPDCRGELRGFKVHGREVIRAYGERYVAPYLLEPPAAAEGDPSSRSGGAIARREP